jgi:hypothetical protein
VNTALIAAYLRIQRGAMVAWVAAMAFLTWSVASATSVIAGGEVFGSLVGSLPRAFLLIVGDLRGLSPVDMYISQKMLGVLPLMLAFYGVFGAVGIFAREVETRTAELTFTLPVRRRTIVFSRLLVVVGGLALLHAVVWFALWLGIRGTGLAASYGGYARAAAVSFLVTSTLTALVLLFSLRAPDYGHAQRYALLTVGGAYALDLGCRLWGAPTVVRTLTIFGVYDAARLVRGTAPVWWAVLLVMAVGALSLVLSLRLAERREIGV